MLTVITPTGGRPEAFSLCERWMARQTCQEPWEWVVVNDIPGSECCTMNQILLSGKQKWIPGRLTLADNLAVAVPYVRGDKVVIIEDDDWYSPGYLSLMSDRLEEHVLVGEMDALYYHVGLRRWRRMGNRYHSSLCQIGFRRTLLPLLTALCEYNLQFLDVELCRAAERAMPSGVQLYPHTGACVGIKGLPGRPGAGIGHKPDRNAVLWHDDKDLHYLRSVIGNEAELYSRFRLGGENWS